MSETSTKPYLIRAIHEWCVDNGYRPYLAVAVDDRTIVPREFVRGGEIVLNVSSDATNHLQLGNDLIEFEARFNQIARQISIPIENVTAIYAAENGQGMAFEVPKAPAVIAPSESDSPDGDQPQDSAPGAGVRQGQAVLSAVPSRGDSKAGDSRADTGDEPPTPSGPGRPKLTRIK